MPGHEYLIVSTARVVVDCTVVYLAMHSWCSVYPYGSLSDETLGNESIQKLVLQLFWKPNITKRVSLASQDVFNGWALNTVLFKPAQEFWHE